ncbi:MAG: 30S ribosomal protein S9 [Dehalococcoidia bacterium]|nr:MAG: 30S ribosomal protein S9 [Dehalococcoidia bacterium]
MLKKKGYSCGTGKRKEAVAQVRLTPGNGAIIVNGVPYEERFSRVQHRQMIMKPMLVTETVGKYDALIKIAGGGVAGQCSAISHGISRALLNEKESFRSILRQEGLLTRDSRIKERQKPGLKRARKAPQYTKR